jgi:Gram-negative bacterial TonB protein C-terminal
MTIQGAEGPAGGISISGASNPSDENQGGGSYGMTIVSTGNSGGGVGDFGVFRDEAVFTVYLNPAETADDPAPPWPLQYALLNPTGETLQDFLPPIATKKRMPQWPSDLLEKFSGEQIALYAVINAEGKIVQSKILQSPNSRLSEILLSALEQWVFRPATMNGRPVAVKIVLGVAILPSH